MKILKAKRIPRKETSVEDIIALFCYYYQQYKYHEARKLPFKRLISMLKVAKKEYAKQMYDLTQITASPHTRKGQGVNKLLEHYKRIINE